MVLVHCTIVQIDSWNKQMMTSQEMVKDSSISPGNAILLSGEAVFPVTDISEQRLQDALGKTGYRSTS